MVPIDSFDVAAERVMARPAIIDGDVTLTYHDLTVMSHRLAGYLSAQAAGDDPIPVALYSPNDARVVAGMLGIMRAGGVIVPLHAQNDLDTAADFLHQVGARCIVYHSSLASRVAQLRERVPSLRASVCLDGGSGEMSLDAILAAPQLPIRDWIDPSGNRTRPVFYWATSGSTGRPKVVIEDCGCFDAMSKATRALRKATGVNVALAIAPMSHGGGPAAFATLTLGGTVIVMRTFDPQDALQKIERHRVTEVWLAPTALYLLLDCPDLRTYDLSSLRTVLLGMAGVSPDRIRDAVNAFGPCVMHSYGQIEASFVTMLDPATVAAAVRGDHPERLLSSGVTVDVNRFAIMDEDDELLSPGQPGEIVVRGACVKRYLDPAATAEAQRSGWHRTGDVGYVDADGFLYITGRVKDVVNMGGFKIGAAEVERAICELDAVQDCAVVAAPDRIRGEVITAVVTVRPQRDITAAAVIGHCRARLGQGKTPASVEFWPELPRSPAGKVDKQRIRATFWPESSRDAAAESSRLGTVNA